MFAQAVALTDPEAQRICIAAFDGRLRDARPQTWAESVAFVNFGGPGILSALYAEPKT